MPRSYRSIVFTAVGWLALSAQHPNPPTKEDQPETKNSIRDATTNIAPIYHKQSEGAKRAPESPPCGPTQYQSNDDLCAQWKAADAAEKAAWWAAFAGWFGGLSFIGVLAAIGVAFHSNWIARDTARRQLRAYLNIGSVSIDDAVTGSPRIIKAKISNTGQTPARDVQLVGLGAIGPFDAAEEQFVLEPPANSRGQIAASEDRHIELMLETNWTAEHGAMYAQGKLTIFFYGLITYTDVFGKKWETPFRLFNNNRVALGKFYYCQNGNDAI